MHYVICYDIESDRLRDRAVKILEKNGCHRIQKSVFMAPHLKKKDLVRLQLGLQQAFERRPLKPGDSIYIVSLSQELASETEYYGLNNAFTMLLEKKLKIIL